MIGSYDFFESEGGKYEREICEMSKVSVCIPMLGQWYPLGRCFNSDC